MANEVILIVEDNDLLREGLREMLSLEDFTVITARNGSEALQWMETVSPELIVSDVTMPVMDGFDFYSVVRSHLEWVTIPFIFLTARAEPEDIQAGRSVGVDDYLTKPVNREELVTTIRSRLARARQILVTQLQQAYLASLTAMANAIEVRGPYAQGHVERVTYYTLAIAEALGWHGRQNELLRFGAILHDVGKIYVPEAILNKPTSLTEEEWVEIRQHPVNGADMIKGIPYLVGVAPIVRHHHERWDGKGYPDSLQGPDIPLGARILTVADAYDVMTSPRPYGKLFTAREAYDEIVGLSGINYDPAAVAAFQCVWETEPFKVVVKKS
jgi:putative two-component system response regulator